MASHKTHDMCSRNMHRYIITKPTVLFKIIYMYKNRASAIPNQRHANMESLYDYGSRVGYWRLHNIFTNKYPHFPITVFAVGMALERNPAVCNSLKHAMNMNKWEVASHGYRWWD